MIPYRAPAPRPDPRFRVEGVELVVQDDAALAAVCLCCGSRKDVSFTTRTVTTNHRGASFGAMGGVVGTVIVNTAKYDVLLAILVGAIIAGVLGGILHLVFKPQPGQTVRADLPYCVACEDKTRAAQGRARVFMLFGLLVMVGALLALSQKVWAIGLVCFAVSIGLFVFGARETKQQIQVRARLVAGGEAFLVGVPPKALMLLSGATPPKKRKKKRALPGEPSPEESAPSPPAE